MNKDELKRLRELAHAAGGAHAMVPAHRLHVLLDEVDTLRRERDALKDNAPDVSGVVANIRTHANGIRSGECDRPSDYVLDKWADRLEGGER